MKTLDAAGAKLSPKLFIETFRTVKKEAPARFWNLRLHPDRYKELYMAADVPESIQLGVVVGPLGKPETRVNCIKPPMGVTDGIKIIQDSTADPGMLVFELHGIPEIVLQNLYYEVPSEPPAQSNQRVN
jgi:hypothetical protein